MNSSYHRTKRRAEEVAQRINGEVVEGKHPDPEYRGVTVWWVVYDSRSNGPVECGVCRDVDICDDLVAQGVLTCSDCEVLRPMDCFAYYAEVIPVEDA